MQRMFTSRSVTISGPGLNHQFILPAGITNTGSTIIPLDTNIKI